MNTLYDDYRKFEEIANDLEGNYIEISEKILNPTVLTPLISFSKLNDISFKSNDSDIDSIKDFINDSYSNFLDLNYFEEDRKGEIIENLAKSINYNEYCGIQTIIYVLNELVSNVIDHSSLNNSISQCYIYSKEYPKLDILDITVMDNGISIPGSFEYYGIDFTDDCDAISKAVNQVSTKSNPLDSIRYSRGFGLWSSLKLIIEGNGGNVLIVSRKGCLSIEDKDNFKYYNLNNSNIFKGNLVALRLKKAQIENFYDLIEINESADYKYLE